MPCVKAAGWGPEGTPKVEAQRRSRCEMEQKCRQPCDRGMPFNGTAFPNPAYGCRLRSCGRPHNGLRRKVRELRIGT